MAFLRLRCERAYNTGAIRTHFAPTDLADRLRRQGLHASAERGRLVLGADQDFVFDDWQPEGGGLSVGWLTFTTQGDIAGLSWKLAKAGVRHRLELSRPRDLDTDDVRSITRFDFRWNSFGRRRAGQIEPTILTFDEVL